MEEVFFVRNFAVLAWPGAEKTARREKMWWINKSAGSFREPARESAITIGGNEGDWLAIVASGTAATTSRQQLWSEVLIPFLRPS